MLEIRAEFFAGRAGAIDSEAAAEAFAEAIAKVASDDFVCTMDGGGLTRTWEGVDGVRSAWRDFLGGFESIEITPGEMFEFENGVLEYVHLTGRPAGTDADIQQDAAAIWRLHGDRLASVEFHIDRGRARASAGVDA
jgi:hypothetical protein